MSGTLLTTSAMEVVDWLGGLGARWGLPPLSCRAHGLLFLLARPVSRDAIGAELVTTQAEMDEALAWLAEEGLAANSQTGWTTETDPWTLVMQALERRRSQELAPARAALSTWRQPKEGEDALVVRQAQRLLDLVEDLAAIDAGTRRLPPAALRRLVGMGGRAARMADRVFGGRSAS